MRIGFLGKGGSGKTTISAAFVQHVAKNQRVVAIDCDHNSHLAQTLHMAEPIALSDQEDVIKQHVRARKDQVLIATTPPQKTSSFFRVSDLGKLGVQEGNITLLAGGTYTGEDVGTTCYHGKLEATELLYHHLLDGPSDVVVADGTAGLDSLGHSMHMVHDVILYVVEPTKRSVGVAKEFCAIARKMGLVVYIVANKVVDDSDVDFITASLEEPLVVCKQSTALRKHDQGDDSAFDDFVLQNSASFDRVLSVVPKNRDWNVYLQRLITAHKKNALAWYDSFYGIKLSEDIDTSFSYEDVI